MKITFLLLLLLLAPGLSLAQSRAVVFIDSEQAEQATLAEELNLMLYYSPTLRSKLQVELFDINPRGVAFSGNLVYQLDRNGQAVSRYRPDSLPYLICLDEDKERLRIVFAKKEQLCLCVQTC
ncbi:hypothetical protein ACFSFZ_01255 [Mixta tenebrionis]|uniref:Uncharacterized protein n=1 Tax=Mixta tenebrionis TaxID=2562439 RepID=A0A506V8A4_9GAMM|nr:hypothetical protein [Mixta tenebrionis]QHM77213.1 hypothetical protein C7M52_03209 [Mixta theicola]TPW42061.1 hypothetical protein FKM52_11955 [Mixta tenebrionis]